jgi:D-alanyl-D-alanine carboxypeptidase/D-alanyl-D-alanine-endopeptidase (penicillin-binding protein 4)
MLRFLICAATTLAMLLAAPVRADDTAAEMKAIAASGLPEDGVGFVLVDLDSGGTLAEHGADSPFIPASVAKLATVYAAERILGADYRFPTRLYRAGTTLYLQGGGDPVLTNLELRDLAAQLKSLRTDSGWQSFVYDSGSVASEPEVNDGQPVPAVYNAGFGALNVDFNRIQVLWSRGDSDAKLAFRARAIADGLNVPADWVAFAPDDVEPPPGANFIYAGDAAGDRWLYSPDLPESLPDEGAIFLPVKNPAANAAQVFRRIAASAGVALPVPRPGAVPEGAALLGETDSPPLSEIIAGLLKFSNNITAELIGMAASRRLTGRVLDPVDSSHVLTEWLKTQMPKVDWHGFELVNHSGLSSANRASPRQIAAILASMAQDPVLADALPKILGDNPTAAAEAKTGTMDFACGLGGFFTTESGKHVAFAIFALDRDRRAELDATFDRRVLAPTPGARAWLGRAHALEAVLLNGWHAQF